MRYEDIRDVELIQGVLQFNLITEDGLGIVYFLDADALDYQEDRIASKEQQYKEYILDNLELVTTASPTQKKVCGALFEIFKP